jgi:tRNA threonylcarbamoyladenosine biosynthesis protein TsaB
MVQELLAEAGLTLSQCDAIAFGAGPGSFTGVRTACGIAQGLAYGAGLPVLPLVTLDAMALACRQQSGATDVLAVLDARMGEVYWAQYHGAALVAGPALCAPGEVAPRPVAGALTACGNGFAAYPDAFAAQPYAAAALTAIMPHAEQLAELAVAALAAGAALSAAQAQPLYLRNKIAYTSAERLVINAAKAAA